VGNDFRATYAYNEVGRYAQRPYCSDLMIRFHVRLDHPNSRIGATLSKYNNHYKACVDSNGDMVIEVSKGKEYEELIRRPVAPPPVNKAVLVKFTNVDHCLIFQFGNETLRYDLGRSPDALGPRRTDIQPQVRIFGSGRLMLSHIAVFRDIHYTGANPGNHSRPIRATEGNPLALGKDEFFVLGDNSPNSEDGRWWMQPGIGNNRRTYRKGIVPREYLMGRALLVYWPSWWRPFGGSSPVFIPNFGQIHFIYGGSYKNP